VCEALLAPDRVENQLLEPSSLGHLRRRVDQLIDANLRYTFGQ
jgi:hypothetical protein